MPRDHHQIAEPGEVRRAPRPRMVARSGGRRTGSPRAGLDRRPRDALYLDGAKRHLSKIGRWNERRRE